MPGAASDSRAPPASTREASESARRQREVMRSVARERALAGSWKAKAEEHEKDAARVKAKVEQLESSLKHFREESSRRKVACTALEEKLSALQPQAKHAEEQLKAVQASLKKAQKELSRKEKDCSAAQNRATELATANRSATELREDLEAKLRQLRIDTTRKDRVLEELRQKHVAAEAQAQALSNDVAVEKDEAQKWRYEVARLRRVLDAAQARVLDSRDETGSETGADDAPALSGGLAGDAAPSPYLSALQESLELLDLSESDLAEFLPSDSP